MPESLIQKIEKLARSNCHEGERQEYLGCDEVIDIIRQHEADTMGDVGKRVNSTPKGTLDSGSLTSPASPSEMLLKIDESALEGVDCAAYARIRLGKPFTYRDAIEEYISLVNETAPARESVTLKREPCKPSEHDFRPSQGGTFYCNNCEEFY